MIKIMKFGEVSPDEIFARTVPPADVERTVSDIIADVRARGDAALLTSLAPELGFEAVIVKPLCLDGEPVSSTRIRTLLGEGRRAEAERLAGHALHDGSAPPVRKI